MPLRFPSTDDSASFEARLASITDSIAAAVQHAADAVVRNSQPSTPRSPAPATSLDHRSASTTAFYNHDLHKQLIEQQAAQQRLMLQQQAPRPRFSSWWEEHQARVKEQAERGQPARTAYATTSPADAAAASGYRPPLYRARVSAGIAVPEQPVASASVYAARVSEPVAVSPRPLMPRIAARMAEVPAGMTLVPHVPAVAAAAAAAAATATTTTHEHTALVPQSELSELHRHLAAAEHTNQSLHAQIAERDARIAAMERQLADAMQREDDLRRGFLELNDYCRDLERSVDLSA